jgi:hypothetical protein
VEYLVPFVEHMTDRDSTQPPPKDLSKLEGDEQAFLS